MLLNHIQYFGHWITEDLSDVIDIYSNIKQLYKKIYAISYNFNRCSTTTKSILFKKCIYNIYLSSILIPNRYLWLNLI